MERISIRNVESSYSLLSFKLYRIMGSLWILRKSWILSLVGSNELFEWKLVLQLSFLFQRQWPSPTYQLQYPITFPRGDVGGNRNSYRQEVTLAKISFRLVALWGVAWTPYAAVALVGVFGNRTLLTPMNSMFPALFCKFASVLDPLVYALSSKQFQSELKRRLPGWLCRCVELKHSISGVLVRRGEETKGSKVTFSSFWENAV